MGFICCLFVYLIKVEGVMDKNEMIMATLWCVTIANFITSTYILFVGEIKQVNVTYVCPTVRKYMSEQETKEIENV